MNIALAFVLADKAITAVSYHQDDTDTHPCLLKILVPLLKYGPVVTGHDGAAHKTQSSAILDGIAVKRKPSFSAVHILATSDFWRGVMPIPTYALGCPKPDPSGRRRGIGSNCDWWLCRDSPRSTKALGIDAIVVPGLARTFLWQPQDSCWGNSQPAEDAPLTNLW